MIINKLDLAVFELVGLVFRRNVDKSSNEMDQHCSSRQPTWCFFVGLEHYQLYRYAEL